MNSRRGFSMVEILVVAAIFGVISAAILSAILFGQRGWMVGSGQTVLTAELRRGLDRISRELSEAGTNTLLFEDPIADPRNPGWFGKMSFQVPQDNGIDEDEDNPPDPVDEPTRFTHRWANGRRERETVFKAGSTDLEWSPAIRYERAAGNACDRVVGPAVRGVETREQVASHVADLRFRRKAGTGDVVEILISASTISEGGQVMVRSMGTRVKLRN